DLPEQPGVKKDQVPLVVHAEVAISAHGGHERTGPARQSIADAGDGIDHPAIERKEKEVFEAGRQVPAWKRLVEDAVAGHGADILESFGQDRHGGDVLVLDAVPVVPEVGVRLEDRGVDLALAEVRPRVESVRDRCPSRSTAVKAKVCE